MKKFKPNQKVVCTDNMANKPDPRYPCSMEGPLIWKDHIYTVEYIEEEDGELWLILEEVPQFAFQAKNFRPLVLDYEFVNKLIASL